LIFLDLAVSAKGLLPLKSASVQVQPEHKSRA
jgi:hypothetical protein